MEDQNNKTINIGSLPFIYTPLSYPSNTPLPDSLPFSLSTNPSTNHIIQAPNSLVSNILEKAYALSSEISGMMDDHGIGKKYAEDFLSYILQNLGTTDLKKYRILDIGCGTGYLLHCFKNLGAEVLGIEPGSHGQKGATRFGVDIIQDTFPSSQEIGTFDIITAFAVLEHIENIDHFLLNISSLLNTNGTIFLAVPNCESQLKKGDISILLHEHWSYFTQKDLINVVSKITGLTTNTSIASFGGSIYSISNSKLIEDNCFEEKKYQQPDLVNFYKKFTSNLSKLRSILSESSSKQIGVYVPGRLVNYIFLLKDYITIENLRFFDDNKELFSMYYPGLNIRIESREDLIKVRPDILLVMSLTFGKSIAEDLLNCNFHTTTILWHDIFDADHNY